MPNHQRADRPWPTLVILALAMGGFAIGTTEFATMSLLPFFATSLGIDAPTAGHVISAYALGVVVGAPVIAVLTARMPRRTLLMALMAMFALGNGLSALAPSYGSMMVFRFLSGLPHGAYFGTASVVATSLVPTNKRTQAVGQVLLGLTVATIIGVPLANWLGQAVGWRWSFGVVAALGLIALTLVALFAPRETADLQSSPLGELGALKVPQVWLTLAIGAIGFGGLFAVYTYLASTLTAVTGVSDHVVPIVLCIFGIGLTAGNLIVPRFADRALMPTAGVLLLWSAAMLALYVFAARSIWTISIDVFLIGVGAALATVLQTRLMDVSGKAQALPAALNHSAFNIANALGPWLGGMAIAAGFGWTSTGWVGALLALGGVVIWGVSVTVERQTSTRYRDLCPNEAD
ncbi:MFS transporter [Aliidongia dinghuensis]|uniref:MFS transporter n=1 Tax=Aliidongia dinghuensis TaxID=1867774 RepID=A0A8J2YNQ7_9PROT|nr:MFS transporter [Aliidongia dinghuensis]GGF00503.1 MFS transporter [Aliidongia dinghuensis]